ncbi:MAG: NAD(P)-binding domain-containing protein [Ruminococcus sp.]|nr:NAD(P)-binding domain-containing protein [Ruminococcus sp.]
MKISIIGTGIYGIALALSLKSNYKVMMWSENKDLVQNFKNNHNLKPITDTFIPNNINISNNMEEVLNNTNLIILVTSIKYVRDVCKSMLPFYKGTPICIATKGIENNTGYLVSDIIKEELKTNDIAVISGPTFAKDLISKEETALSIASINYKTTEIITTSFNDNLKFQIVNDLEAVEICGSIKNVFAIAAGILNGLNCSDSTKALLYSTALNSTKKLLEELNCNPDIIFSHAGIDDLILTCSSIESRNFSYGTSIGKKEDSNAYLNNNTVEGYYTLLSLQTLLKNNNISIPILDTLYDIIINKEEPNLLLSLLQ